MNQIWPWVVRAPISDFLFIYFSFKSDVVRNHIVTLPNDLVDHLKIKILRFPNNGEDNMRFSNNRKDKLDFPTTNTIKLKEFHHEVHQDFETLIIFFSFKTCFDCDSIKKIMLGC